MKEIRLRPRPIMVLMMILAIALVGSAMTPLNASADGSSGDPPASIPTTDSVTYDDGADPGGDSSTDSGLLYDMMTLIVLM